jgi:hypothetical protein
MNNITISVEETFMNNEKATEYDIEKMMEELDVDDDIIQDETNAFYCGNDENYYNDEYTVKDLLKICNYYGIEKNIKSLKCKKQDIISTIIYYESLPENVEIVEKRNRMWAYMVELYNDPKMKKYIIWK